MRVRLGIEVLLGDRRSLLTGGRVACVVHPASVLPDLRHTADVLQSEKSIQLVSLFGPQHGARGEKQDNMIESDSYRDPDTGIPVHSLYSATRRPTPEMLEDVDVLVYDLQDVGTRVYTFIYTMAYCMEMCGRMKRKMIVADRPNPITGRAVEGSLLDPESRSFVGLYPIPLRHGMTVGELALLFNSEFGLGCDLTIIPMEGWSRSEWFDATGLPWVQPSPNMPTLESAVVYPGTVLVEGTELSEGRGTTRPFEYVGAPYIKARDYAGQLNSLGLPGVVFRPAYFQPTFQKWAGKMCGGVQLHVTDRDAFEPCLTGTMAIAIARQMHPREFGWKQPPYEYEQEKMPIEILCGGRRLPQFMESGTNPDEIRAFWHDDIVRFERQRRPYLLYQ
jgi:uncharacterized protein YbbC (DUF1343 family)